MKGTNEFSRADFDAIRALLTEKQSTSRGHQKRIRAQLAHLGFYVSDFPTPADHPFGPDDLDRLLERGRITVVGEKRGSSKTGRGKLLRRRSAD